MARKNPRYLFGLVLVLLGAVGTIVVGSVAKAIYQHEIQNRQAHERAEQEKPLDFGQVIPAPEPTPVMPLYYMPTQTLQRQTVKPTTETADPIPSDKLTGVISMPSGLTGIVAAYVYNGTDVARDIWLIAWEDFSVSRRDQLDFRHGLANPRETVKIFLDESRRATRYQLVAELPNVAFLLDNPDNYDVLAERQVAR